MTIESAGRPVAPDHGERQLFQRRRRRTLGRCLVVLGVLAALGWMLALPHGPGTFRLFGVGVAWWALFAAALPGGVLWLLGGRPEAPRLPPATPGVSRPSRASAGA